LIVVDASVAAKWFLPEADSEAAGRLLTGRRKLLAPDLIRIEVAAAEALLERTERPVEQIAAEVGFGNAQTLRHHFTRVRGVSPAQYRKTFCPVPVD
jgi:predicted nucleic acid-binding protein